MKLYVKTGCPWCIQVIDYLDKNDYEYIKLNVSTNKDLFDEMIKLSGQSSAPTLHIPDKDLLLADFGVEELVPFLEKNNLKK